MSSVENSFKPILPSVSPSALGGNASSYQEKINGGSAYGFLGKEISPGKMEFAKVGGSKHNRKSNKRNKRNKRNNNRKTKNRKMKNRK